MAALLLQETCEAAIGRFRQLLSGWGGGIVAEGEVVAQAESEIKGLMSLACNGMLKKAQENRAARLARALKKANKIKKHALNQQQAKDELVQQYRQRLHPFFTSSRDADRVRDEHKVCLLFERFVHQSFAYDLLLTLHFCCQVGPPELACSAKEVVVIIFHFMSI